VECAATQGVLPLEYMSHGPAATREPVAARPRASTQARSKLDCENMSNHFLVGQRWDGTLAKYFEIMNEKLARPPTQNGYIADFYTALCLGRLSITFI
jgi:hypothetical protein